MNEPPLSPAPAEQDPLTAAGPDDRQVAEIRKFLDGLQERTPQEAIGMSGDGDLIRYLVVAIVASIALAFAGTALPYFWLDTDPTTAVRKKNSAAEEGAAATGTVAEDAAASTADPTTTAVTPSGETVANPDQVLESLGVGEARQADPKKNPLEDNLDKLLDGVD